MSLLEITVARKSDAGWPVVAERTAPGAVLRLRAEGRLLLDAAAQSALLAAALDPKAYGSILGQALFQDQIRDAFAAALTESAASDRLRVLLTVEDEALRSLRWERLCAPLHGGWDLLALNQEIPFSLYLPSVTDRRFPPMGRRDLHALIVAASPANLDRYRLVPFDVAAAVSGVQTALAEIPSDLLVTGDGTPALAGVAGPATLDAIAARITAGAYTLLHVIAHGAVAGGTDQSETILYLANADGAVDPVSGTRLLERLRHLSPPQGFPRFAFLAACETASATAESAGGLGGLAQRLVRDLGMPAVVAMTDEVTVATANALAGAFYRRLRAHGQPDLALVEATAGLAERGDITVPALYSRLAGVSLFSDAVRPLLELTPAEIGHALDRAAPLLAERAPVLLTDAGGAEERRRGFTSLADALRGMGSADPAQLPESLRGERKTALQELDAIAVESLDLSFAALALGNDPPAYDARRPFRGLNPFRAEDREFFFGREPLIQELRQRLAAHPFLPVLGPSGSGKSSLVLAGLVPALVGAPPRDEAADAAGARALERDMKPGQDPLARLDELLARLAASPGVIVVDQFEEVFTVCRKEATRSAFFDRLLALTAERPVVLTMRADFWGECAPYPALRAAMEAHQRLIAPLDAAELRAAIEQQAGKVGLRFEADLAATIIDQVRGEPGAMPLLQHALLELWQRRHGRWLLASEYWAIGGVQGAIAKTAETIYSGLTESEQERVRDIFVRLTRLDDEVASSVEQRDTRRRVALAELVPAGGDSAATKALVARLASAGLVVTSRGAAEAPPTPQPPPTPAPTSVSEVHPG